MVEPSELVAMCVPFLGGRPSRLAAVAAALLPVFRLSRGLPADDLLGESNDGERSSSPLPRFSSVDTMGEIVTGWVTEEIRRLLGLLPSVRVTVRDEGKGAEVMATAGVMDTLLRLSGSPAGGL